ncbi:Dbl homology domain-containing protein [Armillaria gallica]|uniref:Dbl homology domain-containing protein n=1 Tax=Armillaria gallica TaxID=47427 RepID=A0A2H3E0J4_ARMGA|nr:Dbl homology domain-containing protein [Armillaria gallica]
MGSPSSSTAEHSSEPPRPTTKRQHALQELLASERAYASDLVLVREVHMPLARGQDIDLVSSSSSSAMDSPPMTPEDARIVFSNIADLAVFANDFCDALQIALDEDNVGDLFLKIIPEMERPYKLYISRQDTASSHLQSLPVTPALTAYHAQTRTIAASLSHAWDLHSMLIKPVQRLLKYPLLLTTILEETPDDHPDKENIRLARDAVQEVAQRVNEERRRTEVVKDVLKRTNKDLLVRIKSISRRRPPPPDSDESVLISRFHTHILRIQSFANELAQNTLDWSHSVAAVTNHLRLFSLSFASVIGLNREVQSDSFGAFMTLITNVLLPLTTTLSQRLTTNLMDPLTDLLNTLTNPLHLLNTLQNTLLPLHTHLIHMPLSQKNRPPPDLIKASNEYLALRAKLAEELPKYVNMAEKVLSGCVIRLARVQEAYWLDAGLAWRDLWDMLSVEGEDLQTGDTIRVWWERWEEVDAVLARFRIVERPRKTPTRRSSSTGSIPRVSSPIPLMSSSSASIRSKTTKSSTDFDYDIGYDYACAARVVESPQPLSPVPSQKIRRPGTPSSSSIKSRTSTRRKELPGMYVVQAVYPFLPPSQEYTYESYPFLRILGPGEAYEVLREAGHPKLHISKGLRLSVDDEEANAPDNLLLVRRMANGDKGDGEVGWALASYVQPL